MFAHRKCCSHVVHHPLKMKMKGVVVLAVRIHSPKLAQLCPAGQDEE